jgi:hypothetical protein
MRQQIRFSHKIAPTQMTRPINLINHFAQRFKEDCGHGNGQRSYLLLVISYYRLVIDDYYLCDNMQFEMDGEVLTLCDNRTLHTTEFKRFSRTINCE